MRDLLRFKRDDVDLVGTREQLTSAGSIYRSRLAIQSARNELPLLSQADAHQRLILPVLRFLL
jgi:hypothetical protein